MNHQIEGRQSPEFKYDITIKDNSTGHVYSRMYGNKLVLLTEEVTNTSIDASFGESSGNLYQYDNNGDIIGTKEKEEGIFKITIDGDALGEEESKTGGFAIKNRIDYSLTTNVGDIAHTSQDVEDHYTYYTYKIIDNKAAYMIPDNDSSIITISDDVINYNDYTKLGENNNDLSSIDASNIIFTLKEIPDEGELKNNETDMVLTVESTFTQADINNGLIQYVISGDETQNAEFKYDINVTDGESM